MKNNFFNLKECEDCMNMKDNPDICPQCRQNKMLIFLSQINKKLEKISLKEEQED